MSEKIAISSAIIIGYGLIGPPLAGLCYVFLLSLIHIISLTWMLSHPGDFIYPSYVFGCLALLAAGLYVARTAIKKRVFVLNIYWLIGLTSLAISACVTLLFDSFSYHSPSFKEAFYGFVIEYIIFAIPLSLALPIFLRITESMLAKTKFALIRKTRENAGIA